MADEFDEADPTDDAEPIWETPGDAAALEFALSPDEPPRRTRLIIGIVCLVAGLVIAAVAVFAAVGDDADRSADRSASAATSTQPMATTTAAPLPGQSVDTTAIAGTDLATADDVASARWPSGLGGRPRGLGPQGTPPPAEAGDLEPGYYLWNDFSGWHLWLVGGTDQDRVTVTSDAEVSKANATGGEIAVDRLANAFAFARGGAGEPVVGVDFNPGFYSRTFIVTVDGDLPLHAGGGAKPVTKYYGVHKSKTNT